MRTYKSIERKSVILGMPIADLMLLLALLIALVLLGSIGSIFFPVSRYYYLSTVGMILLLYLAMKFINRRKHPNFLFASLSFHFRQPEVIHSFPSTTYVKSSKTTQKGHPSREDLSGL